MKLQVEKLLREKNIEYRIIKLSQKAYTVNDVAKYSQGDVKPEEICKTIILRGKNSGKKSAILLRGSDKLNFPEAKKIFREGMAIAAREEVKDAANVEPGAVCPFLLNVPLFIDKKVMGMNRINCGSGNLFYGLEFEVKDLVKAVNYKIVDLAKISET